MTDNVLHIENLTMQFGGVVAVDDFSMDSNKGEIVALIGPNGAGKTTAFNVISGVYTPTNGRVSFMGKPIIENHPTGKMKRNYPGENAGLYKEKLSMSPAGSRSSSFWDTMSRAMLPNLPTSNWRTARVPSNSTSCTSAATVWVIGRLITGSEIEAS